MTTERAHSMLHISELSSASPTFLANVKCQTTAIWTTKVGFGTKTPDEDPGLARDRPLYIGT